MSDLQGCVIIDGTGALFHPSTHCCASAGVPARVRVGIWCEDDGAEGCRADPADRGTHQNLSVRSPAPAMSATATAVIRFAGSPKSHLVLDLDPAGHRRNQPEQHDRVAADDGTRDRQGISAPNFGEKPSRIDTMAARRQNSTMPAERHRQVRISALPRIAGGGNDDGDEREARAEIARRPALRR